MWNTHPLERMKVQPATLQHAMAAPMGAQSTTSCLSLESPMQRARGCSGHRRNFGHQAEGRDKMAAVLLALATA